jgi:hypothetical protein
MSRIEEIKTRVSTKLKDALTAVEQPTSTQLFFDIKKEKVRAVCNELIALGGRYLVSTGYDNIARDKTLGMVHALAFDRDDIF